MGLKDSFGYDLNQNVHELKDSLKCKIQPISSVLISRIYYFKVCTLLGPISTKTNIIFALPFAKNWDLEQNLSETIFYVTPVHLNVSVQIIQHEFERKNDTTRATSAMSVTPGTLQNEFAGSVCLFKVFSENILSVFSVMKVLH